MAESPPETPGGGSHKAGSGAERRRWPRIRIAQPVRLRSADPAVALEEVSSTVDVSREGIYFLTRLDAYGLASLVMDCRPAAPVAAEKAVHCLVPKSTWVSTR